MIILAYITFTFLVAFMLVVYSAKTFWGIYQEEVRLNRYVVVKTALDIYPSEEEEGEYSEDIRKLISGTGATNNDKIKRATTQTAIDLEEILLLQQWTTSKFEDDEVKSDCTLITFKSGEQILVLEQLATIEQILTSYLGLKSIENFKA